MKNTRIMMTQPMGGSQGDIYQIAATVAELNAIYQVGERGAGPGVAGFLRGMGEGPRSAQSLGWQCCDTPHSWFSLGPLPTMKPRDTPFSLFKIPLLPPCA